MVAYIRVGHGYAVFPSEFNPTDSSWLVLQGGAAEILVLQVVQGQPVHPVLLTTNHQPTPRHLTHVQDMAALAADRLVHCKKQY